MATQTKITKASWVKNPLIAATLHTTLDRMGNAIVDLRLVHKDITFREKNNAIFSKQESTKFCTTLKRIEEAGEHCEKAVEG